ncbi:4Fe-4S dicluster domain-containing protein [Thermofilum sp.]|uniref:4Fe-4S dicluster domain-containing protein n=1 Tax=Thermofilum sp. TaxID=1961369 RepID=UPI00319EB1A0
MISTRASRRRKCACAGWRKSRGGMMAKAIMYDSTKCIGCRACQVACKRWNDLPAEKTSLSPDWTNPPDLSPVTWNYIRFVGKNGENGFEWHFVSVRCMHCVDPPCARACPVGAITKYEEGPVVINQEKCIGCRYCVAVCPFEVPRYDKATGKVYKCHMCYDRIKEGLEPACVATCPTGALSFGDRETLLSRARERASTVNGYLYGADEIEKGTSVFIVTKLPPAELGLPDAPKTYPLYLSIREYVRPLTGVGVAAVLLLAGLRVLFTRKREVAEKSGGE